MREGTWSMYAQAAWAYSVCRNKTWPDAVRAANNELDRKTYADVLASGLKLYLEWQLVPPREESALGQPVRNGAVRAGTVEKRTGRHRAACLSASIRAA